MKRSHLFWGVALLVIGVIMLVNAMGIKLPNGMSPMELLWPGLLIFCGLWVLAGVFYRGTSKSENVSIDLQGAASADLNISHGAGELKIHGGAKSTEVFHGSFTGGLDQKSNRNGDRLEVRLRPARDFMEFPFFGPHDQLDWDVALNTDIPTTLKLNLGANKSELDLRDMNITHLDLDTGASDTRITLPSRGRFRADFDIGAASLEVTVPEGLSARIQASLGAADFRIDQSRFPRSGGFYQSPDFDAALNSVDMKIDAGAASIKVW
jgi:hypothetical protein